MDDNIRAVLEKAGFSADSLNRVRLGRGVIGKTTYAIAAAFAIFLVIAWRIDPKELLLLALMVGVLFGVYFIGALVFSHKNPGTSLLEGADLIHWRHLEQSAAKGVGVLPTAPPIPPPGRPNALPHAGGADIADG